MGWMKDKSKVRYFSLHRSRDTMALCHQGHIPFCVRSRTRRSLCKSSGLIFGLNPGSRSVSLRIATVPVFIIPV